jgi:hypothetical protein
MRNRMKKLELDMPKEKRVQLEYFEVTSEKISGKETFRLNFLGCNRGGRKILQDRSSPLGTMATGAAVRGCN